MAALTEALLRQAEQNPAASYYNLVLLRYQVRACQGLAGTYLHAYLPAWAREG